jgi:hypothetical protein
VTNLTDIATEKYGAHGTTDVGNRHVVPQPDYQKQKEETLDEEEGMLRDKDGGWRNPEDLNLGMARHEL